MKFSLSDKVILQTCEIGNCLVCNVWPLCIAPISIFSKGLKCYKEQFRTWELYLQWSPHILCVMSASIRNCFFFVWQYIYRPKESKNRHFLEQVPVQSTVDIIQLYAETNTKRNNKIYIFS